MQDKLYFGVLNRSTGDYYVVGCTLPAQIGRQSEVQNQILLGSQYNRISRVHGVVERTSRGLIYTDRSTHGTRINGLEIHNSRVSLVTNFQIDVEDYTITRVDVVPFVILHTDHRLVELQRVELLPGRGFGLTTTSGRPELIDLDRWTEWGKPIVGHLEVGDEQPVWVQPSGNPIECRRNKGVMAQARTPLASLDVLEIDRHRLEILHPHEGRIVCGNNRCNLLNPPPLAGNCRFCGHDLAGAGGFSRVL